LLVEVVVDRCAKLAYYTYCSMCYTLFCGAEAVYIVVGQTENMVFGKGG